MNKRPSKSLRKRRGAGTALVLTLFFILLISALVVALLISMRIDRSSTQGYYQSARVQELANGALEEVIADLRSEIDAGSLTNSDYLVNGTRIYVPTNGIAAQPARIGFVPGTNGDYGTDLDTNNVKLAPTLIRVSRANVNTNAIFPSTNYVQTKLPQQRASAVSTTNYSLNGRTISAKRWNSSFLLSGTTTPPARFVANPPDWIYVTRGGSRVVTDADVPSLKNNDNLNDTNTLVGRYSFVVYDAGGLIDVNCAGYPSTFTASTNGPAEIRGKSSVVFAALSSLTGLSGRTNEINNLINWRSKASISASTNGFYGAVTNWMKHGFLQATNYGGNVDNPLLSRKDLINYFTNSNRIADTRALPYLGTFSRSLAAPTARPFTQTNSTIDYAVMANQATSTNRDLANVRFPQSFTVTHYADDATAKTYAVQSGDPLLQNRFSLARLAWLKDGNPDTGTGPSLTRAAAIKSCFGLEWDFPGGTGGVSANGGNRCWNYVGSTGSTATPPNTIKTLAEVAAEGREPNFFELLKAAILSGSLGKSAGPAAFNNAQNPVGTFNQDYLYGHGDPSETIIRRGPVGFYSYTLNPAISYNLSSAVPAPARIPDMQIIRIGANIIDQYDADSWPTAIWFKYAGVGAFDAAGGTSNLPIMGSVTMAYGIENLPYLHGTHLLVASPTPSGTTANTIGGWRQPQLWNVHQSGGPNFQDRPATFQIRAYGSAYTHWKWDPQPASKSYGVGSSQAVDYFTMPSLETPDDLARGTINFTLANSTSSTAFCFQDKPYPLLQDGLPNVSATSPSAENLGTASVADYGTNFSPHNLPNHFVGFTTGITDPNDLGAPFKPYYTHNTLMTTVGQSPTDSNTYALGWLDSSGRFHPYSFLTGVFGHQGGVYNGASKPTGSANPNVERQPDAWFLIDPRTERFSLVRGINGSFEESLSVYKGNNQRYHPSARPKDGYGFEGPFGYPWQSYSYAQGDLMFNSETDSTHTSFYRDPDNVIRPGDGLWGTPATGDGTMTFFSDGASTTPAAVGDRGAGTAASSGRRPVVLNRPFRSVAELGYVFRDQPFKSLDFFSDKSADTALLDVFSLNDVATVRTSGLSPIVAGRINPNAAPASVLQAIMAGGTKKEFDTSYNINAETRQLALEIAGKVMQSNSYVPLEGQRTMVPTLVNSLRTASTSLNTSSADRGNKAYLEAPLRALTESLDFRTWNLFIDLIAQSGQLTPNSQNLSNFSVQAECRVWLHLVIDRYTGEVTARQLEPVYE